MKNRLEVAKELLSEEWFIFIQCDDYEQWYLKVLMDEIFWSDNFRNSIFWHRTYAGKTVSKNLPWNVDIIHFFSKNNNVNINNVTTELTDKDIKSYTKDDNDWKWKYTTVSLQKTWWPWPKTSYDYIDNNWKIWKCPKKWWRMIEEKLKNLENSNRLYINNNTIREKYYLKERKKIWKQIDNFWSDIWNMNRWSDINYWLTWQKPEKLIKRIIELWTKPWDLVLDFHLWSWTTTAVAHKMWRQYIGIEQMDYIEDITIERIKKIIKWEKWWISKDMKWEWWWNIIYMELIEENEAYIKKIKEATKTNEFIKIYKEIKNSWFINYNVNIKWIDENINEFEKLWLDNQKIFLIELLDKNLLYKNYNEINEKNNSVNDYDKKMNNNFYNK